VPGESTKETQCAFGEWHCSQDTMPQSAIRA
jgi:hypothetical protein